MPNDYYTSTGAPGQRSAGSSAAIRAQFAAVQAAFDKLPGVSGAGGRLLRVNDGGTALVASTTVSESAGNLCIGTSTALLTASNRTVVTVNGATSAIVGLAAGGVSTAAFFADATRAQISHGSGYVTLDTAGAERVRVTSTGDVLVGASAGGAGRIRAWSPEFTQYLETTAADSTYACLRLNRNGGSFTGAVAQFERNGGVVGSISVAGTATTYATSSDYRLKTNVADMGDAISTVRALRPVTFTWAGDGAPGRGFIAHELQEVVPEAVVGVKDAIDANGAPVYQGIDTSFIVPFLTRAVQQLAERVEALEAA